MEKYNILIVEDHTLTRFALKIILKESDFVQEVYEAQNAIEAYTITDNKNIDLILMDLGLPQINGIEATKSIKNKHEQCKVVILTSHWGEDEVINALQAGANSYCCKDIEPELLKRVIKTTLEGASWFDAKVSAFVLNNSGMPAESGQLKKEDLHLTSREYEILKAMTDGLTNVQISNKFNLSVNTVKAHVGSILQKMNVDDRVQAVIIALKQKLV